MILPNPFFFFSQFYQMKMNQENNEKGKDERDKNFFDHLAKDEPVWT